jgi:hypothetical protein
MDAVGRRTRNTSQSQRSERGLVHGGRVHDTDADSSGAGTDLTDVVAAAQRREHA